MHTRRNVNRRWRIAVRSAEPRRLSAGAVKAARPERSEQAVVLTLRQDGSPEGRDSLLALFTTAVSRQGRRPGSAVSFNETTFRENSQAVQPAPAQSVHPQTGVQSC